MMKDHLPFDPEYLKQKASGERKQHNKLFQRLKKTAPRKVDDLVLPLHHELMNEYDCLECANCCKSLSPAIHDKDVDRIAKFLRMKPSEVVEKWMLLDEDGDYVFSSQPCPFLGDDNYCSVYDVRPKACREYPHTDRVKQHQLLGIMKKNVAVCPVVYEIVKELRG